MLQHWSTLKAAHMPLTNTNVNMQVLEWGILN